MNQPGSKGLDRMLSTGSTVATMSSPALETASLVSSLTLVDRGRETSPVLNPPAYGTLLPAAECEELIPQPLYSHSQEKNRQYSISSPSPINKPLPALPSCDEHPALRGDSQISKPALANSKAQKRVARRTFRLQTLPETPQPRDLDALNEAFARKGLVSYPEEDIAFYPIYMDVRELKRQTQSSFRSATWAGQLLVSQYSKERVSSIYPQTTKPLPQTPKVETGKSPKEPPKTHSIKTSKAKTIELGKESRIDSPKANRFRFSLSSRNTDRQSTSSLTRALQRFWPAKLLARQVKPPTQTDISAVPETDQHPEVTVPSTTCNTPGPVVKRSPRPAGRAPPNPVTRMKQVLSVLLDERFSININTLSCTGEVDVLLQRTRDLLAHPQPIVRGRLQEVEGSSPEKPAVKSTETMSELDGLQKHIPKPSPSPSIFRRIMLEINDLPDLFALALVNKASYMVFKTDELGLIKNTLKRISPPAWELRQIQDLHCDTSMPGAQSLAAGLYLRHYTWDLMQVTTMKFLLQDHCQPLLSNDLITGLQDPFDPRATRVDAAIWRIWTFCHLFGNRKDRENDRKGQKRWLRGRRTDRRLPQICRFSPDPADFNTVLFSPPEGFAQGNPSGGLTRVQLLDMLDVWIAMASLLDFLRKHTTLARRNGVFDDAEVPPKNQKEEARMLRAWLDFILTLGPAAVLELAPAGPNSNPEAAFHRAKSNGWTQWTPPGPSVPRSNFLIGIVRSILQKMPDDETKPSNEVRTDSPILG
ncbi:hypothetical protein BDV18DRAFT_162145 [Aspergillus unguis]